MRSLKRQWGCRRLAIPCSKSEKGKECIRSCCAGCSPRTTRMRYGFIIDQRACIGCHACTVACKQENGVALGDFRTWVKYTEKGTFPNVTRSFLVERCNHCDDAPCVNICPVTADRKS